MRAVCVSQESGCLSECGCMANYRWPNIPGHSSHGRLASVSPFLDFGRLSESFEQGNMAEVMVPVSNPGLKEGEASPSCFETLPESPKPPGRKPDDPRTVMLE